MSVLLNPIPADVVAFIDTIRRFENIGGLNPIISPQLPQPKQKDSAEILKEFGGKFTAAIEQLKNVVETRAALSPPYVPNNTVRVPYQQPSTQPLAGAPFRQRRPISEITCYRCFQKGHYQGACPNQQPVATTLVTPAENELADLSGQGRQ